ncbi:hypothetical protein G1E_31975 [Pseudomonas sp. TJI-51]|nr:hypothetical protein G1E_31975 [Pseudomonas sp. TJI-51]
MCIVTIDAKHSYRKTCHLRNQAHSATVDHSGMRAVIMNKLDNLIVAKACLYSSFVFVFVHLLNRIPVWLDVAR